MSGEAPITVCKGICGLGNRLLFLTEVMRRCQRVGSRLYVSWNDYMYSDTPNENAFPRAFVLHPRFDAGVREIRQLCDLSVWPPMWAGLLDKDIYSLPERYREISEASVASDGPPPATDIEVLFGAPPPYRNRSDLERLGSLLVENISPSFWITQETERFYIERLAGGPSLGVHVRQCSWEKRKIDRGDLHQRIESFLASSTYARVFLATDGSDVVDEFRFRFGERLVTRPKWMSPEPHALGRMEPSSLHKRRPGFRQVGEPPAHVMLKDAAVELQLLARCDQLMYQQDSGFSVVAALFARAAGHAIEPWGEHSPTLRQSLFEQMLTRAAAARGSM